VLSIELKLEVIKFGCYIYSVHLINRSDEHLTTRRRWHISQAYAMYRVAQKSKPLPNDQKNRVN